MEAVTSERAIEADDAGEAAPAVVGVRPWRIQMAGRDPLEENRVSTPLELLFDLCFVVDLLMGVLLSGSVGVNVVLAERQAAAA
jgi:hypothetical protein